MKKFTIICLVLFGLFFFIGINSYYSQEIKILKSNVKELKISENKRISDEFKLAKHIKEVNPTISDSESIIMSRAFFSSADSVKSGSDFAWLLAAMAEAESHYQKDKTSKAGAKGVCQIMPNTGKAYAEENGINFADDSLFNPEFCIRLQAIIMKDLRNKHGLSAALVAYNGGPKHAKNWEKGNKKVIPRESKNYVIKVKTNLRKMR